MGAVLLGGIESSGFSNLILFVDYFESIPLVSVAASILATGMGISGLLNRWGLCGND